MHTHVIGSSSVNVATTRLTGQFAGLENSVADHVVNNQLEKMVQCRIGGSHSSRGVVSYPQLSAELEESPANVGVVSNTLELGENVPMYPYSTESTSGVVQVSSSLLPSTPCRDRPGEHRRYPGPNSRPPTPPTTTPK